MDILDKTVIVRVIKKTLQATTTELIPEVSIEEQGWRPSIIQKLTQPSSFVVARELKDFVLQNGELYFRGTGRILACAISKAKAKVELKCVHDLCCGEIISVYYKHL